MALPTIAARPMKRGEGWDQLYYTAYDAGVPFIPPGTLVRARALSPGIYTQMIFGAAGLPNLAPYRQIGMYLNNVGAAGIIDSLKVWIGGKDDGAYYTFPVWITPGRSLALHRSGIPFPTDAPDGIVLISAREWGAPGIAYAQLEIVGKRQR